MTFAVYYVVGYILYFDRLFIGNPYYMLRLTNPCPIFQPIAIRHLSDSGYLIVCKTVLSKCVKRYVNCDQLFNFHFDIVLF